MMNDKPELVKEQYKNAANLEARIALHRLFSTSKVLWSHWVFEKLRQELPDKANILELGCGPGTLWKANAKSIPADWQITLTDFSPGMLDEARANLADGSPAFEFGQADAQELPFDDNSFDGVIANHMLYHVPDLDKAFAEIKRVLKPQGHFFAATNGATHMQELAQLAQPFSHLDEVARRLIGASHTFTLENGAELLQTWFANVRLELFDDNLRVTQAEPLLAYIESVQPIADQDFRAQVLQSFQSLIDRDGAIDITKAIGLFIATRE